MEIMLRMIVVLLSVVVLVVAWFGGVHRYWFVIAWRYGTVVTVCTLVFSSVDHDPTWQLLIDIPVSIRSPCVEFDSVSITWPVSFHIRSVAMITVSLLLLLWLVTKSIRWIL
jgi:hypothetical protein